MFTVLTAESEIFENGIGSPLTLRAIPAWAEECRVYWYEVSGYREGGFTPWMNEALLYVLSGSNGRPT